MKKYLLAVLIGLTGPFAYADGLTDQISAAFVGNAKFATEFTTKGTNQVEFLDNFIEIGSVHGNHIAALDLGALGNIIPQSGQFKGVDWTTGGKIHVSSLIKNSLVLPAEWQFLNNVEVDARASYDWTLHHPFYGLTVGYPFK